VKKKIIKLSIKSILECVWHARQDRTNENGLDKIELDKCIICPGFAKYKGWDKNK
jgi:hypothetical protein